MIHRATLTFVSRSEEPVLPPVLAELGDSESDFLERHVAALRGKADKPDGLRSRFQPGADASDVFSRLLAADDEGFPSEAETIVVRLVEQMKQVTNPKAGILAIIASGEGADPSILSVLKLEAIHEAADFERLAEGRIRLDVLEDLLPAPGQLEKGISWPDPRPDSDAIVQDTLLTAARYFFNSCQLQVGAKSSQAERALAEAIVRSVPVERLPAAFEDAAEQEGPADDVVSEIRERFPQVVADVPALGAGGAIPGSIRRGMITRHRVQLSVEGIDIVVPVDQLDRVTEEQDAGGRWVITVVSGSRASRKAR